MTFEARPTRRNGRTRVRLDLAASTLERRELLAFTPLGFSLPDLTVTGFSAPVAAWGAPFAVTVDVRNLGSSSMIEPLALAPGSTSTADAGPSKVDVYLSTFKPTRNAGLLIGTIDVPTVPQNTNLRLSQTFILPQHAPGFPNFTGSLFVSFRIDISRSVPDLDRSNNTFIAPLKVALEPPLPDLAIVGLDVPPVMQPGDTIQPNILVANFGTVDTATQGVVDVQLVATTNPQFQGATTLSSFRIETLQPLSEVPMKQVALGDVNLDRPINVEELRGAPVTLPLTPATFFITALADPSHKILQIHDLGRRFRIPGVGANAETPHFLQVGPPIPGLPPAGVVSFPSSPFTNPFPFPSFPIRPSFLIPPPTSTVTTASLSPALSLSALAGQQPRLDVLLRPRSGTRPVQSLRRV